MSGPYSVKCDDCKKTLRMTDSVGESAAGGRCDDCKPKTITFACPACSEPLNAERPTELRATLAVPCPHCTGLVSVPCTKISKGIVRSAYGIKIGTLVDGKADQYFDFNLEDVGRVHGWADKAGRVVQYG